MSHGGGYQGVAGSGRVGAMGARTGPIFQAPTNPVISTVGSGEKKSRKHKACLACKAGHLKCDHGTPSCGRCATKRIQCVYTETPQPQPTSTRPLVFVDHAFHDRSVGSTTTTIHGDDYSPSDSSSLYSSSQFSHPGRSPSSGDYTLAHTLSGTSPLSATGFQTISINPMEMQAGMAVDMLPNEYYAQSGASYGYPGESSEYSGGQVGYASHGMRHSQQGTTMMGVQARSTFAQPGGPERLYSGQQSFSGPNGSYNGGGYEGAINSWSAYGAGGQLVGEPSGQNSVSGFSSGLANGPNNGNHSPSLSHQHHHHHSSEGVNGGAYFSGSVVPGTGPSHPSVMAASATGGGGPPLPAKTFTHKRSAANLSSGSTLHLSSLASLSSNSKLTNTSSPPQSPKYRNRQRNRAPSSQSSSRGASSSGGSGGSAPSSATSGAGSLLTGSTVTPAYSQPSSPAHTPLFTHLQSPDDLYHSGLGSSYSYDGSGYLSGGSTSSPHSLGYIGQPLQQPDWDYSDPHSSASTGAPHSSSHGMLPYSSYQMHPSAPGGPHYAHQGTSHSLSHNSRMLHPNSSSTGYGGGPSYSHGQAQSAVYSHSAQGQQQQYSGHAQQQQHQGQDYSQAFRQHFPRIPISPLQQQQHHHQQQQQQQQQFQQGRDSPMDVSGGSLANSSQVQGGSSGFLLNSDLSNAGMMDTSSGTVGLSGEGPNDGMNGGGMNSTNGTPRGTTEDSTSTSSLLMDTSSSEGPVGPHMGAASSASMAQQIILMGADSDAISGSRRNPYGSASSPNMMLHGPSGGKLSSHSATNLMAGSTSGAVGGSPNGSLLATATSPSISKRSGSAGPALLGNTGVIGSRSASPSLVNNNINSTIGPSSLSSNTTTLNANGNLGSAMGGSISPLLTGTPSPAPMSSVVSPSQGGMDISSSSSIAGAESQQSSDTSPQVISPSQPAQSSSHRSFSPNHSSQRSTFVRSKTSAKNLMPSTSSTNNSSTNPGSATSPNAGNPAGSSDAEIAELLQLQDAFVSIFEPRAPVNLNMNWTPQDSRLYWQLFMSKDPSSSISPSTSSTSSPSPNNNGGMVTSPTNNAVASSSMNVSSSVATPSGSSSSSPPSSSSSEEVTNLLVDVKHKLDSNNDSTHAAGIRQFLRAYEQCVVLLCGSSSLNWTAVELPLAIHCEKMTSFLRGETINFEIAELKEKECERFVDALALYATYLRDRQQMPAALQALLMAYTALTMNISLMSGDVVDRLYVWTLFIVSSAQDRNQWFNKMAAVGLTPGSTPMAAMVTQQSKLVSLLTQQSLDASDTQLQQIWTQLDELEQLIQLLPKTIRSRPFRYMRIAAVYILRIEIFSRWNKYNETLHWQKYLQDIAAMSPGLKISLANTIKAVCEQVSPHDGEIRGLSVAKSLLSLLDHSPVVLPHSHQPQHS